MKVATSIQPISFEQDARLVNKLLEVLSREQSSLVMADIDAIEALIEEKSVLLQSINLTVKSRYDALASKGLAASEVGMVEWLKQHGNAAMNASWEVFQRALNQAKEMNRLNGMLISKHFSRNQQLLNHLQGNSGVVDGYGRNGQAQAQSPSRGVLRV
jgi:flagellar biosynthesis protein FlgN